MPTDASLNKLLTEALAKLDAAMCEIIELPREEPDVCHRLGRIGRAIGLIREIQEPIFKKHPELRPPPPADYIPDPDMTEEEIEATSRLSSKELDGMDEAILLEADDRYLKVARIVVRAADNWAGPAESVPYAFYVQRIRRLIEKGALESQGDLRYMRFSEVRKVQKRAITSQST